MTCIAPLLQTCAYISEVFFILARLEFASIIFQLVKDENWCPLNIARLDFLSYSSTDKTVFRFPLNFYVKFKKNHVKRRS